MDIKTDNPFSFLTSSGGMPDKMKEGLKLLMSSNSPLGSKGKQVFEKMNTGMAFAQIFTDAQLKFIRESFEKGDKLAVAKAFVDGEEFFKKNGFSSRELYIKVCEFYDAKP